MTELEMFAKSIIEDGNQWWELEKSDKGGLYMFLDSEDVTQ